MGKKWRKMLRTTYSLKFKNIILFLNRGLYFFSNGHIRNVVSTLPNVVKIDVENQNVVSTLSNVVQFNVETTLFYVVNFNVDIHNVVLTLIWRCARSRRHINLKQRWTDVEMFARLFIHPLRLNAVYLFSSQLVQYWNQDYIEAVTGDILWKKMFLKYFANFTGKHLCWSLFLIKRDLNTGAFLWNLQNL